MATKPITFSDLSGEMGADTVKFGLGADTGKPPLPEVKRLRNEKGTMFDVEKGGSRTAFPTSP